MCAARFPIVLRSFCAAWLLTSAAVVFYLPFLVLFGVLTGLLTGLVLKLTLPPLQRIERYLLQ